MSIPSFSASDGSTPARGTRGTGRRRRRGAQPLSKSARPLLCRKLAAPEAVEGKGVRGVAAACAMQRPVRRTDSAGVRPPADDAEPDASSTASTSQDGEDGRNGGADDSSSVAPRSVDPRPPAQAHASRVEKGGGGHTEQTTPIQERMAAMGLRTEAGSEESMAAQGADATAAQTVARMEEEMKKMKEEMKRKDEEMKGKDEEMKRLRIELERARAAAGRRRGPREGDLVPGTRARTAPRAHSDRIDDTPTPLAGVTGSFLELALTSSAKDMASLAKKEVQEKVARPSCHFMAIRFLREYQQMKDSMTGRHPSGIVKTLCASAQKFKTTGDILAAWKRKDMSCEVPGTFLSAKFCTHKKLAKPRQGGGSTGTATSQTGGGSVTENPEPKDTRHELMLSTMLTILLLEELEKYGIPLRAVHQHLGLPGPVSSPDVVLRLMSSLLADTEWTIENAYDVFKTRLAAVLVEIKWDMYLEDATDKVYSYGCHFHRADASNHVYPFRFGLAMSELRIRVYGLVPMNRPDNDGTDRPRWEMYMIRLCEVPLEDAPAVLYALGKTLDESDPACQMNWTCSHPLRAPLPVPADPKDVHWFSDDVFLVRDGSDGATVNKRYDYMDYQAERKWRRPNLSMYETAWTTEATERADMKVIDLLPGIADVQLLSYLYRPGGHVPRSVVQIAELCRQVGRLHDACCVHGDVRLLNVVFSEDGLETWLIDMDFARPLAERPRYPTGYTEQGVIAERHPAARQKKPILMEHDRHALAEMVLVYVTAAAAERPDVQALVRDIRSDRALADIADSLLTAVHDSDMEAVSAVCTRIGVKPRRTVQSVFDDDGSEERVLTGTPEKEPRAL